ncbi:MAG: hypothetical protein ACEQSA_00970 [Weeksellaceae bacterium]
MDPEKRRPATPYEIEQLQVFAVGALAGLIAGIFIALTTPGLAWYLQCTIVPLASAGGGIGLLFLWKLPEDPPQV